MQVKPIIGRIGGQI